MFPHGHRVSPPHSGVLVIKGHTGSTFSKPLSLLAGDLLGAWFLCVNAGRTGAVLGVWEWREEASVRRAAGMCLCSEWAP